MKKGLLAMLSLCTCALIMDLSNATTTYNIGALQEVVLTGKYGNVSIQTSRGRDVSKDFSCLDCASGIRITNLGVELSNDEDKLLRVLVNGQEVANLSVEQDNRKFNEKNVLFLKNADGTIKICTAPNGVSKKNR